MPRYLIQSLKTGEFLVPCESWGAVWERYLSKAGSGVFCDIEYAEQLIEDYVEKDDMAIIVNLDDL